MKYKHLQDFLDTKKLNIQLRYNTDDEEEVNKYVLKNLLILGVLTKEEIEEIEKMALKEVQEANTKDQQTQEQKTPSFSGSDYLFNLILNKQNYEKLNDVIKQGKEMFETAFKDENFSKIKKESEEIIKKINSIGENKKPNQKIEEDKKVYNSIKNIIFEKLSYPFEWEVEETMGTRLTYKGDDIKLVLVLLKFDEKDKKVSTIHIHGTRDQLELSTETFYDGALEKAILNVIDLSMENKATKRAENFFS